MQDHWSRLFAISRLSVCLIVQEICQLIMDVLMPKHIKKPEGNQLKEIVQVLNGSGVFHNALEQLQF